MVHLDVNQTQTLSLSQSNLNSAQAGVCFLIVTVKRKETITSCVAGLPEVSPLPSGRAVTCYGPGPNPGCGPGSGSGPSSDPSPGLNPTSNPSSGAAGEQGERQKQG